MVNDLGPISFPDDESVNAYLKVKLPEWHKRLGNLERNFDDQSKKFELVSKQVEGWKKTISWAIGVLYVAIVGAVVGIVIRGGL